MTDYFKNDFFKSYQDFAKNFQAQGTEAFSKFKAPEMPKMELPKVDMNKFFSLQRNNIEAFAAASKSFNEDVQEIARRGADFLRDNMEDVLSASRNVASSGSAPDKAMAKQAEFAKSMLKNSAEQARELSEMISKANFGAFDIISSRFSRASEEAKDIASKKTTKKAA